MWAKKLVNQGHATWQVEDLLSTVLWTIQWSITTLQYSPFTVFVWPSPLLNWSRPHMTGYTLDYTGVRCHSMSRLLFPGTYSWYICIHFGFPALSCVWHLFQTLLCLSTNAFKAQSHWRQIKATRLRLFVLATFSEFSKFCNLFENN